MGYIVLNLCSALHYSLYKYMYMYIYDCVNIITRDVKGNSEVLHAYYYLLDS